MCVSSTRTRFQLVGWSSSSLLHLLDPFEFPEHISTASAILRGYFPGRQRLPVRHLDRMFGVCYAFVSASFTTFMCVVFDAKRIRSILSGLCGSGKIVSPCCVIGTYGTATINSTVAHTHIRHINLKSMAFPLFVAAIDDNSVFVHPDQQE